MLARSQHLNPECEHVQGDMRSVRLGRTFDAVLIQDALAHLTTEDDLRQALVTAYVHCRPGGVVLLAPDFVRETFMSGTAQGGHDEERRAFRYLGWVSGSGSVRLDVRGGLSRRICFTRRANRRAAPTTSTSAAFLGVAEWLRLMAEVGFQAAVRSFDHSELPEGAAEMYLGVKPRES